MIHFTFREVRCGHGKVRCLVHSNFMDRGMVFHTLLEARVGHGEVRVVSIQNLGIEVWSISPLGRFGVFIGRL